MTGLLFRAIATSAGYAKYGVPDLKKHVAVCDAAGRYTIDQFDKVLRTACYAAEYGKLEAALGLSRKDKLFEPLGQAPYNVANKVISKLYMKEVVAVLAGGQPPGGLMPAYYTTYGIQGLIDSYEKLLHVIGNALLIYGSEILFATRVLKYSQQLKIDMNSTSQEHFAQEWLPGMVVEYAHQLKRQCGAGAFKFHSPTGAFGLHVDIIVPDNPPKIDINVKEYKDYVALLKRLTA